MTTDERFFELNKILDAYAEIAQWKRKNFECDYAEGAADAYENIIKTIRDNVLGGVADE